MRMRMHMHLGAGMLNKIRTTVEIPEILRKKLILEALETNQKGFSGIIVTALEEYYLKKDSRKKN